MGKEGKWRVFDVCMANKKFFFIAFLIAIVGSSVVSLSIPKTYISRTTISIDSNDKNPLTKGVSFSGIKSMLSSSESEVLTEPYMYIKVLESPLFIKEILNTRIGKEQLTYADYLQKKCKHAWWFSLIGAEDASEVVKKNIKYELKLKTGLIIIQVCDQDPCVANALVDTVVAHLHAFMTNYMIVKAKNNLANKEMVRMKAATNYHNAMSKYVSFANANNDLNEPTAQIYLKDLKNERDRTFELYEEAINSWNVARMEVQHRRPTFYKIKVNTLATQASSPKWLQNIFIWIFYAMLFTLWFVLYREKFGNREISSNA